MNIAIVSSCVFIAADLGRMESRDAFEEDVYRDDDDVHSVDACSSLMSASPLSSEQWTILDEKRSRRQVCCWPRIVSFLKVAVSWRKMPCVCGIALGL